MEPCPICGEGVLTEQQDTNKVNVDDREVEVSFFYSVCNICGSEQANSNQLKKNKINYLNAIKIF